MTAEDRTRYNTTGLILRMAYALSRWPEDRIHRVTLRAFLPPGTHGAGGSNRVSAKFKVRLVDFERQGLIRRDGDWVRVINRAGLAGYGSLLSVEFAALLRQAIAEVRVATFDPDARRRELLALQRLMQEIPGQDDSGRGRVRLLPRGGTL